MNGTYNADTYPFNLGDGQDRVMEYGGFGSEGEAKDIIQMGEEAITIWMTKSRCIAYGLCQ